MHTIYASIQYPRLTYLLLDIMKHTKSGIGIVKPNTTGHRYKLLVAVVHWYYFKIAMVVFKIPPFCFTDSAVVLRLTQIIPVYTGYFNTVCCTFSRRYGTSKRRQCTVNSTSYHEFMHSTTIQTSDNPNNPKIRGRVI